MADLPRHRTAFLALLLALSGLTAAEGATSAYREVSDVLARQEQRLPGSSGFAAAQEAVLRVLRSAGLQPQLQTFSTVVPSTLTCRLTADGRPVQAIPFAPNGVATTTTWGRVIQGPVAYLGNGRLAETGDRPIAGSIVVLDADSEGPAEFFALGARGVVVVGDRASTQWQVARHGTDLPFSWPRVWVDREEAERAGLLRRSGPLPAGTLEIATRWDEARTANLWVLLPAAADAPPEKRAQTIVLSAVLDTFGATPDRCPQLRSAANAALLTETAVRLSRQRLERNVLVVFFGSHRSAQEGSRRLWSVLARVMGGAKVGEPLAKREAGLEAGLEREQALLPLLEGSDWITGGFGGDGRELRTRLRERLVAQVNELNYELLTVGRERRDRETAARRSATAAACADLDLRRDAATRTKQELNALRQQLSDGRILPGDGFAKELALMHREQEDRCTSLAADLADVRSDRALEEALAGAVPVMHLALDLADARRPFLANPFSLLAGCLAKEQAAGHFRSHLKALSSVHAALPPDRLRIPLFTPDQTLTASFSNLCTPLPRILTTVPASALAVFGAHLQTLGDPLDRDELPIREAVDLEPLAPQFEDFFVRLAACEMKSTTEAGASTTFLDFQLVYSASGSGWRGIRTNDLARGSEELAGPARQALVFAQDLSSGGVLNSTSDAGSALAGHSGIPMGRPNALGYVVIPNVVDGLKAHIHAVGFASQGWMDRWSLKGSTELEGKRLFFFRGGAWSCPLLPTDYNLGVEPKVLESRTDSMVKREVVVGGRLGHGFFMELDPRRKVKSVGGGLLLTGADAAQPEGHGLAADPVELLSLDALWRSAEDTAVLNHSRLDRLRARNLINRPVEDLQADADQHRDSASAARAAGQVRLAAAHDTAAAVIGFRAWVPLRDSANDLLRAVILLLVLSIPFAFCLERLVVGATSIYRQIAGFMVVFLGTFAALYATHPAFAIVQAPIIIFLAFFIILLSGFVIAVVMGRFKHEIKALQGLSSKAHSADAGSGTAFAAVLIGISGMRNRPLKTGLTIVTVTLLTFTILVFASFESVTKVVETRLGRARGADHILVQQPNRLGIPYRVQDAISALHGQAFEVAFRHAVLRDPFAKGIEAQTANLLLEPSSGEVTLLESLVGLEPVEVRRLGGLFPALSAPAAGDPPLYLPQPIADQIGTTVGARVLLRGQSFTVAGIFDPGVLKGLDNLDGTSFVPPNFTNTIQLARERNPQAEDKALITSLEAADLVPCSVERVAITTPQALASLGGKATMALLWPKPGADLPAAARDLAKLVKAPVHAAVNGLGTRYFLTSSLEGSGWSELLVPLLLGGLIIFSSLLGSIVDRRKEIFTYSALGLSPFNVGALFFAESAVIAVVGGMGGYLLCQGVYRVLLALSDRGLVAVPDINFSSTSSLAAIFAVMAMVILSTIYPALMAGRSANPGVNRAWRMPAPQGDRLAFAFPFTVPAKAFAGIVGFIREHFENHGDSSLDCFSTRAVAVARKADGRLAISAEVALAPFDLGVLQRFSMTTRASDIAGIDEVVVELERENGAPGNWVRGNRGFIDDLRNQFLLWRSLPVETQEHYQQVTAGAGAPGEVRP